MTRDERWKLDSQMYDLITAVECGEADAEDIEFLQNLRSDLNAMHDEGLIK